MMPEDLFSADEIQFFQAIFLLEKYYSNLRPESYSEVGSGSHFRTENIRFSVSSALSFPVGDISSITHNEDYTATNVEVNFLGLHGANSPLPSCYTEKLAGRDCDENPVKDFFDFFHHRYLSLLYRVWKKYKYHVQFETGATDSFSEKILHFVGLSKSIQKLDTIDLDKAKILPYISQLSTRNRSPRLIAGVVAHYFSLSHVKVEEWVFRNIDISENQRNTLNHRNCSLGNNFHLGQSMVDVSGKFNLRIERLEFNSYIQFTAKQEQVLYLARSDEICIARPSRLGLGSISECR